ncbi:MAG TPA: sigma-70 family RNA polymerase sigma factor [Candidatus Limnocylindrales bacterium]|jgi:RNA polymerase sigma-70 factor (ECF subfamily)
MATVDGRSVTRRGLLDDLPSIGLVGRMADTEAVDAAYSAFFRAEFGNVTRAVYLVVHDRSAAEDLSQEAFAELLVRWDRIATYERPDAWVRRIAIRKAVRFARRERLRGWLTRWIEPPPRRPEAIDPDLVAAIRSLPPQQRAAVVLHYFEDRPLTEVATMLGCSHATAKVHVFKARRRLAELLGPAIAETDDVL